MQPFMLGVRVDLRSPSENATTGRVSVAVDPCREEGMELKRVELYELRSDPLRRIDLAFIFFILYSITLVAMMRFVFFATSIAGVVTCAVLVMLFWRQRRHWRCFISSSFCSVVDPIPFHDFFNRLLSTLCDVPPSSPSCWSLTLKLTDTSGIQYLPLVMPYTTSYNIM